MFGRCATLCCLLTVGLWGSVPVHAAELHPLSKLKIERNGDLWTCSGVDTDGDRTYSTIQFDIKDPSSGTEGPLVVGDSLVVMERIPEPEGSMMCFIRESYCLTRVSVASGEILSSTYLTVHTNAEHPMQARRMFPWREHVLVYGYYQEEPGLFTKKLTTQMIDPRGELISIRFDNDLFYEAEVVDRWNDLLICTQEYQGRDSDGRALPTGPYFRLLDLPSLTLRATHPKDPLILSDMTADADGNLYCLRRDTQECETCRNDEAPYPTTRHLVKYSIEPWQELWTRKIEPESDVGYPRLLQFRDGLLWYAMYDSDYEWVNDSEEKYRWIEKPLDPETGEPVDTDQRFDPYRTVVDVEGQPYAITWLFGSFRVEPLGSPVGKWEAYR